MTDFYQHFNEPDLGGTWRIISQGRGLLFTPKMIHVWADVPEYIPQEFDIHFNWGPHYNWSISSQQIKEWLDQLHVVSLKEIVEVFREPFNDVDASFKGRSLLIASFANITDAIYFKMLVS